MNVATRLGVVVAFVLVAAAPSHAATAYNFSYTMTNGGHVIAGSFQAGAASGAFVDTSAITAINVTFDGQPLAGPMVGNYYDVGSSTADPIVSFTNDQNAFIFSNCSARNCASGVPANYNYFVLRHSNSNQNVDVYFNTVEYSDSQPNTSWTLSVQSVPEPGTWATMTLGLALLTQLARRRGTGR